MRSAILTALALLLLTSHCAMTAGSRTETDAPRAQVVIRMPGVIMGGKKPHVLVDGRKKRARLRNGDAVLRIAPGNYGLYKSGSALRKGTFILKADQVVTVTMQSPSPAARSVSHDSQYVRLVVVEPLSVVSANTMTVSFGKKSRRVKLGKDSLCLFVAPGKYSVTSASKPGKKGIITLTPGSVFYFVNRGDPLSHKVLGDKLYRENNLSGALAHYRAALKIDPEASEMYRRYAELALRSGTAKEAEAALRQLIESGRADGETYRGLGDIRMEQKKYREAGAFYDKALIDNPFNARAMIGLATAHVKAGDADRAIRACKEAIDLEPDSARYYRILGEAYLAKNDTIKAMTAFRSFFDRGGSSNAVAAAVGAYEYRLRRFEDAVSYLSRVKGRRSQSVEHLLMLGESHFRLGNYKDAWPLLRRAANRYPRAEEWPQVVEMLIMSYMNLNKTKKASYWVDKYEARSNVRSATVAFYRAYLQERSSPAKAAALYQRNTKRYPRDHRNYLRLGLLKTRNRKTLSESVPLLKKAASLVDTIPEAWLEIATVYRRLGKADEELSALRVFVASEPQHPDANARIGELMLRKGKTGEAIGRLEKAAEEGADDPKVLLALAKGYQRSGRTDDAVATLEKARGIDPDNVEIHRSLADLYRRSGRIDQAIAALARVIELRRDNRTLLLYAQLLHQRGHHARSEEAIHDILATEPGNMEVLMVLGKVLRAQQRYEEAIEVYREAAMIDPSSSEALRARADAHFEAGQITWAKTFHERALKRDSRNALAHLGLARIARTRGNKALYDQHLARARRYDSDHPEIRKEYASGR